MGMQDRYLCKSECKTCLSCGYISRTLCKFIWIQAMSVFICKASVNVNGIPMSIRCIGMFIQPSYIFEYNVNASCL